MSDEGSRAATALFDLRTVIALLFGVYGVVLTVVGLVSSSRTDNARSGGIAINFWTGIGMLVLAAVFATWAVFRPLRPAAAADD